MNHAVTNIRLELIEVVEHLDRLKLVIRELEISDAHNRLERLTDRLLTLKDLLA